MSILNILTAPKSIIEISILWFVIYQMILFFEGSRAIQVMRGIIVLLLLFFLFKKIDFTVLNWLMEKIFGISVIALLIIFHPEIRQGLARLGQGRFFGTILKEEELESILKEIGKAAEDLSKDKVGALIAIEKSESLSSYVESGVAVDAKISSELIETIFTRNSILHDGGMVIQHGRITATGCIFPLTTKQDLSRIFGTRHRAALGLAEETDALIIVISEERQDISLFYEGKMYRDMGKEELVLKIKDLIKVKGA